MTDDRPDAARPDDAASSRDGRPDRPAERAPSRDWSETVLALGLIAGLVVLLSLNVGETAPPEPVTDPLERAVRAVVNWLAAGAEIAAALVIGWGVLHAVAAGLGRAIARVSRRADAAPDMDVTEGLRLRLGRMLALGVEFTLASDILRTAVAPTRADILTLGAIVLLRTLLNLFLEREIREGEHRERSARTSA